MQIRQPSDYRRVEAALRFLETHAQEQPALEEIAHAVGLSPFHFQRVFRRWAGVSPKRFLQSITVAHARRLLRESRPLLDVAFETGLSGSSRLYDLFVAVEAMTPGQYKALGEGLVIRHGIHPSPFGNCLIAVTDRGVCALEFLAGRRAADLLALLERHWARARFVDGTLETAEIAATIFDSGHVRGTEQSLRLFLKGTNFQLQVWRALLRIPAGCAISYGELAERIGRPSAVRATAQAVAHNPIAVLIPCHRVLRRHGELGGYKWGAARKLAIRGREAMGRRQDRPADELEINRSAP